MSTKLRLILRILLTICLTLSMGIPVAALAEYDETADQTLLAIEYDTKTSPAHEVGTYGILSTGFDLEFNPFMVRTTSNTWARCFGYNQFYDLLAPFLLINLDTLRFPFEYDGKDWMVQLWKGRYVIFFNGAEVGLYEKPAGRPVFYDCSDTTLDMSMRLYQGDELFLDYSTYNTWWVCAFRPGNPLTSIVPANKLRMTGTIRFEEQAMLDAFLASFEANRPKNITGQADGLLFTYDWQTG